MVIHMDRSIIEGLSHNEKRLLLALSARGGSASPADLVSEGEFSVEVEAMSAASWLESKGLASISESTERFYVLADASAVDPGLPERMAVTAIAGNGGSMPMADMEAALPEGAGRIAIGWLKRKGLADIRDVGGVKTMVLTDAGRAVAESRMPDEELLARMAGGPVPASEADPKVVKDLMGRQGMVAERIVTSRTVTLTEDGLEAAASGIELRPQVTDITDRIIQSGEWRDAEFRRYDIQTFAPTVHPAKKHMLTRLGNQVRRLFTDMGFAEMKSEYVQPAFWNLDVLYTPQDHPARDLQDTFYLEHPSSIRIEDEGLVEAVRAIHEDGGDTGSTGWGGEWSRDRAEMALLRTHSTVSSIRYIAEHPDAPRKAFSISRIFRKESIDSTHLPEFTQIEGIVIDEDADFDMLVSMIREFYSRMGFDQIRIRPAYFPYTEPSLELEVFFNGKWMELGGAGIFRPEVVAPFGVEVPVLAWGFGFERLAMLKWGITDIRDLYISDIDGLRSNRSLRSGPLRASAPASGDLPGVVGRLQLAEAGQGVRPGLEHLVDPEDAARAPHLAPAPVQVRQGLREPPVGGHALPQRHRRVHVPDVGVQGRVQGLGALALGQQYLGHHRLRAGVPRPAEGSQGAPGGLGLPQPQAHPGRHQA